MNTPFVDPFLVRIIGVMDGIHHDLSIQPFSAAMVVCAQISTRNLFAESAT